MKLSPPVSPQEVLLQVANALPQDCRQDVIIIGSLAAGYHFFSEDGSKGIRTKDIDCMFSPHAKAVAAAARVTERLLQAKWTQRQGAQWSVPGGPHDAADKLPMVRLQPPTGSEWFIELLGAPRMWRALNAKFPGQAHALAKRAGNGMRMLLDSPPDLDQALAICNLGLLASLDIDHRAFAAMGRRVIAEVVEPLEQFGQAL